MDRISYKDGYVKGLRTALAKMLQDNLISLNDYKEKLRVLSSENIIVPEQPQFFKRNYIDELRKIKSSKNMSVRLIPLIKEIEHDSIFLDYGYKNINEMLIDGAKISRATTSEVQKVGKLYYDENGGVLPLWKGFNYKTLIFLSRQDQTKVKDFRNKGLLTSGTSYENVESLFLYNFPFFNLFR